MPHQQHIAKVQDLQIALHVIERAPGLHQVVGLLLAHLAGGKCAQCGDPFHQRAHRRAASELQQTVVEVDGRRVAQIDHDPCWSVRRRFDSASASAVDRRHNEADHRVKRSPAATRRHTCKVPAVGAFPALDRQAAWQLTNNVLQHVRRKRGYHPLARRNRIEADLDLMARVPGGLLGIDQEAGNPVRYRAVLVVAVAVHARVERRSPVESRTGVGGDPVELLHLRAGLEQELHGLAVYSQRLGLIHAGREVRLARAIGLVDARTTQLGMRREERLRHHRRLVRVPHPFEVVFLEDFAALLQYPHDLGGVLHVYVWLDVLGRKDIQEARVVREPHRIRVVLIHLPGGQRQSFSD